MSAQPSQTDQAQETPSGGPPDPHGDRVTSVSVSNLLAIRPTEAVTAEMVAAQLLAGHADYASGAPVEALVGVLHAAPPKVMRTRGEWIAQAGALFRDEVLIDGRRVILGLAITEARLWNLLKRYGVGARLRAEIETRGPKLVEELTPQARDVLNIRELDEDVVETRSDAPSDEDLLFREPFAEALALRIRAMRAADRKRRPLMLLLDGPWGSGKSTVMGFVQRMLETPAEGAFPGANDRWIAVSYNAWQYQRVEQPWWILANAVIKGCIRGELSRPSGWMAGAGLAVRQFVFRTFTGRMATVLAALAAFAIGVALFTVPGGNSWVELLKNFVAVVAVLFGVVAGAMKFLAAGDKASGDYLGSRSDPMGALEQHLIDCLKSTPRPVVVFVDDLDRCDAAAVVRLLEGVQILFKQAPVVFLFAGDQRWITHSFEIQYAPFREVLEHESRPLGSVFLEKTFQLALWLPPPVEMGRKLYWDTLLGLHSTPVPDPEAPDLSGVTSEAGLLAAGREVEEGGDYFAKLAFRREAVRRLAAPDLERELQDHTLRPLMKLLEPNPRAMKRLVMAYGMARSVDILSGRNSPPHALALWTVIAMRWPDLAAALREDPDRLEPDDALAAADPELAAILASEEVRQVVAGPKDYGPLTVEELRGIVCDVELSTDA